MRQLRNNLSSYSAALTLTLSSLLCYKQEEKLQPNGLLVVPEFFRLYLSSLKADLYYFSYLLIYVVWNILFVSWKEVCRLVGMPPFQLTIKPKPTIAKCDHAWRAGWRDWYIKDFMLKLAICRLPSSVIKSKLACYVEINTFVFNNLLGCLISCTRFICGWF